MGCCGQNRQAWREWNASKTRADAPIPPLLQNPAVLQYKGAFSLVVKGSVTGYTYLFDGQGNGLTVDARDAPALIATGKFAAISSEGSAAGGQNQIK
jgi:hypothetical protein